MASSSPEAATTAEAPSGRVRLRRKRERGSYERETIDAILDEALIAHLGIVEKDGQPLVIPTLHVRCGDLVYCHGAVASRTLRVLRSGAPVCLTVSLLDGLVLARAAMHHSANYRSVVLVGAASSVEDPDHKRAALRALIEHIIPGRWDQVRPPSDNELKATAVLAIPIAEASAKLRTGPPLDDEQDLELPAWAGVIPLALHADAPLPDPRLRGSIEVPQNLAGYRRPGGP